MNPMNKKLAGAAIVAAALLQGTAVQAASGTVAFLMPDQASTRYEEHDFPGFKAEMEKLCPDCTVIYQNADADVARQQQQSCGSRRYVRYRVSSPHGVARTQGWST